jgi:hypothetical protein
MWPTSTPTVMNCVATSKRRPTPAQLAALTKGRGSGAGGRPTKEVKKVPTSVSFEPELLARLDEYAETRSVSRSAAITELVETGLERAGSSLDVQ